MRGLPFHYKRRLLQERLLFFFAQSLKTATFFILCPSFARTSIRFLPPGKFQQKLNQGGILGRPFGVPRKYFLGPLHGLGEGGPNKATFLGKGPKKHLPGFPKKVAFLGNPGRCFLGPYPRNALLGKSRKTFLGTQSSTFLGTPKGLPRIPPPSGVIFPPGGIGPPCKG